MTNDDESSLSAVRLLGLRRFPGFERVDVDDLAKLLAATTERTIPAGNQLAKRGAPLASAYFVIEGTLRTTGDGAQQDVTANETAGMIHMIAEHPDGLDIVCVADAVVLELEKADFLAFNSENFDMLEALLKNFSSRVLAQVPLEGTEASAKLTCCGCSFVERLVFLRSLTSFGAFSAETSADLAAALEESHPHAGVMARAGEPIGALHVVVAGALRFGAAEIGPGGAFGLLHVASEAPLAFDLVATKDTILLSCPREIVADLLEDNVAFTLAWLGQLARRLLELKQASVGTGAHPFRDRARPPPARLI